MGFDLVPVRHGRPLKEGPRHPGGKLVQTTGPDQRKQEPDVLSFTQQHASNTYGRAYAGSKNETRTERRLISGDVLRHARRALEPQEIAVMDMLAGRGLTVAELAFKTNRSSADLSALYRSATSKLAAHFEASGE